MDKEGINNPEINQSYDSWAATYDSVENKTRDLEARVLRQTFLNPHYGNILELGCGTGKNTQWLSKKADHVTAVDLSEEMISRAQKKTTSENVTFTRADITDTWPVKPGWANLIICSLVLEHIENLDPIFLQAQKVLKRTGYLYICELHPSKQYLGSRARFETEGGLQMPEAYVHHLSDYLNAAGAADFRLYEIREYFDEENRKDPPRLLSLIFEKRS